MERSERMRYKSNKSAARRQLVPFYLLIPGFFVIGVFVFFPILRAFSYSLHNYSLLRPQDAGFIGLDNFRNILNDDLFFRSVRNTLTYAISVTVAQFLLGFSLALSLREMKRGTGVYRTIVFAPWAISGVLTSVIWLMFFNTRFGAINDLLMRADIIDTAIAWRSTAFLAMFSVVVAATWRGIPFFAIALLASLQSIPHEINEAARIDGAGSLKTFFYITLPYVRETIVLTTLLRFIWTFNDVDIIYSFTGGGPANATLTLPVYITQEAIQRMNFGYGSALTVSLTIILLTLSFVYLKLNRDTGDFSA